MKEKSIILYRTLSRCMKAFGAVGNGYWEWANADGEVYRESFESVRKRRLAAGCWAWIENKTTIHLWVGKRCTKEELFRVLAHEMGHAERPYHRSVIEEQKAAKYERVAISALENVDVVWEHMGR